VKAFSNRPYRIDSRNSIFFTNQSLPLACGCGSLYTKIAVRKFPFRPEPLRSKECLHEFAFAADNHIRKTFEPFVVRHFRLAIEPICKQSELICRNLARTNSVEKMIQQARRKSVPADFRHYSIAGRRSRERYFRGSWLPPQDRRSRSCAQQDSTVLCP
jgi:hypothetical protein